MKTTSENTGRVVSVNVSEKTGTLKKPVAVVRIDETGVAGDAHAGHWHRQVSLLAMESIERFSREHGREFACGEFAENITTESLDLAGAAILDKFVFPSGCELELTQIGKACHADGCAIFQQVGRCVMPKEGIFCRVARGGDVAPGDEIRHVQRSLGVHVVTMSDRASRGAYEDKSGPKAAEILGAFFEDKPWRVEITRSILPDDPALLRKEIKAAQQAGVDIVVTTGGTGIAPRDITPDVVTEMAEKIIPGIMEMIRVKYGAMKPAAQLSRSVAAIIGEMLVYTLPGSARAVEEYLHEILPTLEHCLFMLRGIDKH